VKKPTLNRSEWSLMHAVWRLASATVREIHEAVAGETDWAYSTTKTLLERMEKKGLLTAGRVGNVKVYSARVTRKQLVSREVKEFLDIALDGSLAPLVPYIARNRRLSDAEVKKLRKLLENGE